MASAIILQGESEFMTSMKGLEEKMNVAARNIVSKGGLIIQETAKQEFRANPGDGPRTYTRKGVKYVSKGVYSAPRPPNPTNRTGNLQRGISMPRIASLGNGRWKSEVSTSSRTQYAAPVEYGTSTSRPFPYMEMGIKDSSDKIKALAEREWASAQM